MIEIRKISNTQLDGVNLYLGLCNGMVSVKKVYARDEKEAEEKVRAAIENSNTEKEREYLAYIDEHISTVKKVWLALQDRLNGCYWLEDWYYFIINDRINRHDQSKYDGCEFGGYRQFFYPENDKEKNSNVFNYSWNHHQKTNDHHWEYWLLFGDSGKVEALKMDFPSVIEMLCDWTAMSVKFKNKPSIWFDANKEKMVLHHDTLQAILHWLPLFDDVYNQMTAKVVNEKEDKQ